MAGSCLVASYLGHLVGLEAGADHEAVGDDPHPLVGGPGHYHLSAGVMDFADLELQPNVQLPGHGLGHFGEIDDRRVRRVQCRHSSGVRLDLVQLTSREPAQPGHPVGPGPG